MIAKKIILNAILCQLSLAFITKAIAQNKYYLKETKSYDGYSVLDCKLDSLKSKRTLKELCPYPQKLDHLNVKRYSIQIQQRGFDGSSSSITDSLPSELLTRIQKENVVIHLRFENIWVVQEGRKDSIKIEPFYIHARK